MYGPNEDETTDWAAVEDDIGYDQLVDQYSEQCDDNDTLDAYLDDNDTSIDNEGLGLDQDGNRDDD